MAPDRKLASNPEPAGENYRAWLRAALIALALHSFAAAAVTLSWPVGEDRSSTVDVVEVRLVPGPTQGTEVASAPLRVTVARKEVAPAPEIIVSEARRPAPARPSMPSVPEAGPLEETHKNEAAPRAELASLTPESPVMSDVMPAGVVPAAEQPSEMTLSWLTYVRHQLEVNKRYPPQALRRRREGRVDMTFWVRRDGTVVGHKLNGSTGFSPLDQEAVTMLYRAAPFPPLPLEFSEEEMEVTVPVVFNLGGQRS